MQETGLHRNRRAGARYDGSGKRTNAPQPLYWRIEDASKKTASIVHPDPTILNTTTWTEWKIPLVEISGVNLNRIKTIYIGVGDRVNPQPDGRGRAYIDNIGLTRTTTERQGVKPPGGNVGVCVGTCRFM